MCFGFLTEVYICVCLDLDLGLDLETEFAISDFDVFHTSPNSVLIYANIVDPEYSLREYLHTVCLYVASLLGYSSFQY